MQCPETAFFWPKNESRGAPIPIGWGLKVWTVPI